MDEPRQSPPPVPEENLQSRPPTALEPGLIPPPRLSAHPLHTIFLGPDGLRVPWRLLLYLVMGMTIVALLATVRHFWHPRLLLWNSMIVEVEILIAAVAAALIMARFEKRPFDAYGLPPRLAFGKQFWVGMVWGIASLTVLMFIMRAAGIFYFGGLAIHGTRILKFAAFYALFFLLVGLGEEFVSRGYTLFTLTQGMGFWPAAILMSALFGAIHLSNQGEVWIGILGAAVIGFFFCLTLRRTGNLWFAVGFHASWDWGESYLYSVPDSGGVSPGHLLNSSFHGAPWLTGGSVGPEGSVLLFVIIALTWAAFDRVYPQAKYPG
ncbi:MAG: CPBP family intramembrane metalloprotease [Acidobacteriia bacterium]|nr:CPBP family intramembrane metalloprotease [Terriglobia bacterium]